MLPLPAPQQALRRFHLTKVALEYALNPSSPSLAVGLGRCGPAVAVLVPAVARFATLEPLLAVLAAPALGPARGAGAGAARHPEVMAVARRRSAAATAVATASKNEGDYDGDDFGSDDDGDGGFLAVAGSAIALAAVAGRVVALLGVGEDFALEDGIFPGPLLIGASGAKAEAAEAADSGRTEALLLTRAFVAGTVAAAYARAAAAERGMVLALPPAPAYGPSAAAGHRGGSGSDWARAARRYRALEQQFVMAVDARALGDAASPGGAKGALASPGLI